MDTVQARPLSTQDMAHGMEHEQVIAAARARLEAAVEAQQRFIAHLRQVYSTPESGYVLANWVRGFEPIQAQREVKSNE